jgi:soluble lytic murein transglycosylase
MSSMDVKTVLRKFACTALVLPGLAASVACHASDNDGSAWDQARAQLSASQQGPMAFAVERWKLLTSSNRFAFNDYAGFVLLPRLPGRGEAAPLCGKRADRDFADPARLVAFFDREPPLTNPAARNMRWRCKRWAGLKPRKSPGPHGAAER